MYNLRKFKLGFLPGDPAWHGPPAPVSARPSGPDVVPGHEVRIHAGTVELADMFDLTQAMFEPGLIGEHDRDPLTTPLVQEL